MTSESAYGKHKSMFKKSAKFDSQFTAGHKVKSQMTLQLISDIELKYGVRNIRLLECYKRPYEDISLDTSDSEPSYSGDCFGRMIIEDPDLALRNANFFGGVLLWRIYEAAIDVNNSYIGKIAMAKLPYLEQRSVREDLIINTHHITVDRKWWIDWALEHGYRFGSHCLQKLARMGDAERFRFARDLGASSSTDLVPHAIIGGSLDIFTDVWQNRSRYVSQEILDKPHALDDALHLAIVYDQINIVQYLLSEGHKWPHAKAGVLVDAARFGFFQMLKFCILNGCDYNAQYLDAKLKKALRR